MSKELVNESPMKPPLLVSPVTGRLHLQYEIVVGTSIEYVLWINRE